MKDSINNNFNLKNTINEYLLEIINTTESCAISLINKLGNNDPKKIDQIAVDTIRSKLNSINMNGTIKIGEGERDKAPMLYIGEKVGTGLGRNVDIAIDPVEGTNYVSSGSYGGLSVIAITEKNGLFFGPDIYFNKIVVGSNVLKFTHNKNFNININNKIDQNIEIISRALNKNYNELKITILNRKRHNEIINELKDLNVSINLIEDGDLWPGILTSIPNSDVDAVFGIGGLGESVLTACGLKLIGGIISGNMILPSIINNRPKNEINNELENLKYKFNYITSDPYNLYHSLDINHLVPGNEILLSISSITGNKFLDPMSVTNGKLSVMSFFCLKNQYSFIKNNYFI